MAVNRMRWRTRVALSGCLLVLAACPAAAQVVPTVIAERLLAPGGPVPLPVPRRVPEPPPQGSEDHANLPIALAEPGEEILPINLATALRLADARAWDIALAVQQLRIAVAQLQGARALWLPDFIGGLDYLHHDGPIQNADGTVTKNSHGSLFTGFAPLAIGNVTDAIFIPLAQRQVVRAEQANVQTATNDTVTDLAFAYFDALQARADLAAIEDVVRRAIVMVRKTREIAPEYVPDLEVARVRAAEANFEETREVARRRWRVASAEVARVLRLQPTVLVAPLEPPQLQITLIPPERRPEELIPVALMARPELTSTQALVEAARQRLRQERLRPLLPIVVARGAGTTPPFPLAYGEYGAGVGGTLNTFGSRTDFDVEAIWELRNLGLGNRALIRQRDAEYGLYRVRDYRFRDIVAREVVQAWADLQSAYRRTAEADRELRQALVSATRNVESMTELKRLGGRLNILIIRPQEVIQSLQALQTAYFDYFGTIADYNRAQFALYRAMGSPAQALATNENVCRKPPPGPVPAALPPPANGGLEEAPPPRQLPQP